MSNILQEIETQIAELKTVVTQSNVGVGGYCLTKDPWFLSSLGDKNGANMKLPSTGRSINDMMPGYAANQIFNHLRAINATLDETKLAVLGYSFKSNSSRKDFSVPR